MPVPLDLRTARARELVDRVAHGKPIEGVNSPNDLLALAGACLFAARTQESLLRERVDWSKLPEGRRESWEGTFPADLHAAVEFCARLAESLYDLDCEEAFGPRLRAIVYGDPARPTVVPLEGKFDEIPCGR